MDNPLFPLQQVARYCDKARARYGFLISDQELVVLEFCKDAIEPGIAATRSRRRQVQHADQSLEASFAGISIFL